MHTLEEGRKEEATGIEMGLGFGAAVAQPTTINRRRSSS